jgi:hypothetical protein
MGWTTSSPRAVTPLDLLEPAKQILDRVHMPLRSTTAVARFLIHSASNPCQPLATHCVNASCRLRPAFVASALSRVRAVAVTGAFFTLRKESQSFQTCSDTSSGRAIDRLLFLYSWLLVIGSWLASIFLVGASSEDAWGMLGAFSHLALAALDPFLLPLSVRIYLNVAPLIPITINVFREKMLENARNILQGCSKHKS